MAPLIPETVETERLTLRPFAIADFDAYGRMVGDAEVMRFIGGAPLVKSWEVWRNFSAVVGHWALRGYGLYAVVEKKTGDLVGRVGLLNPIGWPGVEIAWTLCRDCWGKGYATEAAAAIGRVGFGHLEADRLISLIHLDNIASQRVAERLGAVRDGTTDFFGPGTPTYVYRHDPARFR